MKSQKPDQALRSKIHEVIYEADTPAGKTFDISLLVLIIISVLAVILESVKEFDTKYHSLFTITEWVITVVFTLEYALRIYSVKRPSKYILSFYGIIDLLAILPTYISLVFVGSQYLLTIRAIRLLRIFRLFKLVRYLNQGQILLRALKASRIKITVFLVAVLTIILFVGSAMYVIESNQDSGFTSIPKSMYWAVVTVTTVGYGDITPQSPLGQFLSAILMITGYALIAVPTGIVSVEIAKAQTAADITTQACPSCSKEGHDPDAKHCKYCGELL